MDGRMDESTNKHEYFCVFFKGICPVRMQFKLQPENLLEYCKICHINPTNKQESIGYDYTLKLLDMYVKLDEDERKPFLEVVKALSEKQRQ